MIAFACPHCEKKLRVRDELAGKKGQCPNCSRSITIPNTAAVMTPQAAALAGDLAEDATLPPPPPPPAVPSEIPTLPPADHDEQARTDTQAEAPRPPAAELYSFLAPAKKPDELGRLGPYRVLKVLGAGGMGVVFKAEDPALQRIVALKVILPALAASSSARQRFLREARAAAAIEHDHIVSIYRVGEDRGVPFLAMQFLHGESLDVRLQRTSRNDVGQPLPLPEVLRIGREMAEALAAAQEAGQGARSRTRGNNDHRQRRAIRCLRLR
jgi:hypothetical protein